MERSSCASEACETAADRGVEVERATKDAVAGASPDQGLIALAAAARAYGLAVRRIEPLLAPSFERGVGRNKRSVFEDADLVSENVDLEHAPPRRVGHAVEIAADTDHALMRSAPLESQHRPVRRSRQGFQ